MHNKPEAGLPFCAFQCLNPSRFRALQLCCKYATNGHFFIPTQKLQQRMHLDVTYENSVSNIEIAHVHLNLGRNMLCWAKVFKASSYSVQTTTCIDIEKD
ncbi:hypothetical protein L484_013236 [Morus notabilis]|uniref:Uncharacterized protein n=1 Tax=Morus notabilis TaxID=981085 RepID=W9S3T3_9ROSA|nr:hypothetical protein L484_013236 [Morus notabilis]